jgi:hypothetical protein
MAEDEVPQLFRDRGRLLGWPVDIEVYVGTGEGRVLVFFHGSSWGGRSAMQRDRVTRLVTAFADGVEHEMAFPSTAADLQQKKRRHRAILR